MLHVIPLRDERQHELGMRCWCDPQIQWLDPETGMPWANELASPLVIHMSADCRETSENLTGEQAWPGAEWAMIEG